MGSCGKYEPRTTQNILHCAWVEFKLFGFMQAPIPDTYRGLYRADHPSPAEAYADTVKNLIDDVHKRGRKVCCLVFKNHKFSWQNVFKVESFVVDFVVLCRVLTQCCWTDHLATWILSKSCTVGIRISLCKLKMHYFTSP